MRRVHIVGGGPAGLSAAIHAARAGASVTVFERNDHCGAKLLATGGGHCNVANTRPLAEWPALFGRRGRFIQPALEAMPTERLLAWLDGLGQPCACADGFHYFPASNSAKAVRDALLREAERLDVKLATGVRITGLSLDAGRIGGISSEGGTFPCDAAVIAAGGKSYPATGSTWDGCRMAESVGHKIVPAYPGLVGLRCANLSPDLAGLVLPDAAVTLKTKGKPAVTGRGDLLLTHNGVSGPAVLDLSASVAQALDDEKEGAVAVLLRWRDDMDAKAWLAQFAEWRRTRGASPLSSLLKEKVPQRLARRLCGQAGVPENATAANLAAAGRDALAANLGAYPAMVVASEGWDKAMITRGGVSLREIDPATLESKKVSGLYFAGETLDVDGPCGGYNLHWAFASGALAGNAAGGQ